MAIEPFPSSCLWSLIPAFPPFPGAPAAEAAEVAALPPAVTPALLPLATLVPPFRGAVPLAAEELGTGCASPFEAAEELPLARLGPDPEPEPHPAASPEGPLLLLPVLLLPLLVRVADGTLGPAEFSTGDGDGLAAAKLDCRPCGGGGGGGGDCGGDCGGAPSVMRSRVS